MVVVVVVVVLAHVGTPKKGAVKRACMHACVACVLYTLCLKKGRHQTLGNNSVKP